MENYGDISIPLYLIIADNLKVRNVRIKHLIDFDVKIIRNNNHDFLESIRTCILNGIKEEEDFLIIADATPVLSAHYKKNEIIEIIIAAHKLGCELLCGGIGGFNHAVSVGNNLYWIDNFKHCHFIVIFKSFFATFLKAANNTKEYSSLGSLSELTTHTFVMYPFISDFSDNRSHIIKRNIQHLVLNSYKVSRQRLLAYKEINDRFSKLYMKGNDINA